MRLLALWLFWDRHVASKRVNHVGISKAGTFIDGVTLGRLALNRLIPFLVP